MKQTREMKTGSEGTRRETAAQDIVCISSIDWDFIWQGHQQVMSMLAAQGHRVLFIENTGIRSVNFGDLPRLRKRLASRRHSVHGFRQELPNLYIYSPLALPFPYWRIARRINRFLIMRNINRWMKSVQFEKPIVWTFLPTPLAMELSRSLDPKLMIYYCIDNFAASSASARKVLNAEKKMFERADLVFVTSHQLKEYAAKSSGNVHLFPFGVDYENFEKEREAADRALPADIAAIPGPRVGYVGGIHKWIDFELLKQAAALAPDLNFTLVGPLQEDVSELKKLPNVHFLGPKKHAELPSYVRAFDACLIPYKLTDYTDNVYPTKTNEYLAMGKPVVSTPLREIRLFNERHGDLVRVAADAQGFVREIRAALAAAEAAHRAKAIETARANSWRVKVAQMLALIEQRMEEKIAGKELRWREQLISLYRGAQRRALAFVGAAAIAAGLLFYSPLPWMLAEPLRGADAPKPVDAIVVLGGGVGESGNSTQGYDERVRKAVDLYRAGLAGTIIFSSGYISSYREPELMKTLALSLGVPEKAIILETRAASTRENGVNVSAILKEKGWRSILLVTSPYHMRRATAVFDKTAPGLDVARAPVTDSLYYAKRRAGMTLSQLNGILHEYLAIVVYRLKGWL
jgi:uncharacterized SAM-binding protein YcdF (DUF218 family)/glycosyltransferase involved in cell wall biosynthesis